MTNACDSVIKNKEQRKIYVFRNSQYMYKYKETIGNELNSKQLYK